MPRNIQLIQLILTLKEQVKADRIERILVGAIVVSKGNILLVRRSASDDFLPGYIEIPGGKLEKKEDILTGVCRELYEETGLKMKKIQDYVGFFNAVSPDGKSARQFNFLLESRNNEVVLSTEHSQYLWWNVEDVKDLDLMPMIEPMKIMLRRVVGQIKELRSASSLAKL
jgi:8-oxo-dGTP diphosphatase